MAVPGVRSEDLEVCSETVRVESKLFYLDLKENARGRYLKVSEKGTGRERSTIIVPAAGVVWFMDLFNYYTGGGDDNGALSNKELQLESKVFYFDVGENPRGRFLRISEGSNGPQRAGPRGRTSLIIPSGGAGDIGWVSFRDTLVCIHEAQQMLPQPEMAEEVAAQENNSSFFSNGGVGGGAAGNVARVVTTSSSSAVAAAGGPAGGPGDVPVVRAGNKRFFFDLGSNQRGSFLRITEVVGVDRTSIIVPTEALNQFYEAMEQILATNPRALGPSVRAGGGVQLPGGLEPAGAGGSVAGGGEHGEPGGPMGVPAGV